MDLSNRINVQVGAPLFRRNESLRAGAISRTLMAR